jgi:2-amino-4-hydroxy-6-hydroxymethyldihydropteridine diphosphokinase
LIVYLGLGSNINAHENINKAKAVLANLFENTRFSQTFESEAVGFEGDNFLNLVAEITVRGSLETLIKRLKEVEDDLGRVRAGAKFSSRHIDIDILLFGDLVCSQPIILPREEIRQNAYVLWPLAELVPDLVEPGGSLTYAQLWSKFDKNLQQVSPI